MCGWVIEFDFVVVVVVDTSGIELLDPRLKRDVLLLTEVLEGPFTFVWLLLSMLVCLCCRCCCCCFIDDPIDSAAANAPSFGLLDGDGVWFTPV